MPIFLHQIGPQPFVSLEGEVVIPGEQMEIEIRPGVPGVGLWRMGERGEPFELHSKEDVFNWPLAKIREREYQDLRGQGPWSLVHYNFFYDQLSLLFVVLNVRSRSRAIAYMHGGFNPASGCLVEATWTLVAIQVQS